MKQLVEVEEVEAEGLVAFLGKKIVVWCVDYIRTGTLVGVDDKFIKLGDDSKIVYETGELSAGSFKDAQGDGKEMYVMVHAICHFGPGK